ncbi:ABC transporter ATP-binding protein [Oribacterium sp. HCP28S3_H8]|uniref:ABC transporter ATP-binding protein n=1 Tax=Oribacterium sp. HCP28S3_H8 TaxID=3438945 RepID=UPI003F88DCE3
MSEISLVNVSKLYKNGFYAVKDCNVTIHDHEFFMIIGPSGCGKSTTLRMIAGLEKISSGELYIDGELSNMLEPQERNLAMVFQNYALYPHMTVFDNIAFSLKVRKLPKEEIERQVMSVADMLGISALLHRKPAALSGGQRQRVAIGSAIVRNARAFLMDEPLSNLDAKLRAEMRVELSRLHKKLNATMIYVTHDQVEAMTLADRIMVMKDGIVQQVAAPMELYRHPINQFVAGFIGSPEMNFIPVKSREDAFGFSLIGKNLKVKADETVESAVHGDSHNETLHGNYAQKDLILGVRPEDFIPVSSYQAADFLFEPAVVENLGNDYLLHGYMVSAADPFGISRKKEKMIVISMKRNDTISDHDRIPMQIVTEHMQLFDPESGRNLLYPGTPADPETLATERRQA